jgi:outer membrane translocation and assembly module TamA
VLFRKFIFYFLFSTLLFADSLELYFKGNQNISERELYNSLELHKPYLYEFYKEQPQINSKTIDLALLTLRNYYKTKGYFNAKLSHTQENNKLIVHIQENDAVLIKNLTIHSDLDLSEVIPFALQDRFESDLFTQSKKDIARVYGNESYCNAKIDAKTWIDIQTNEAYLLYDVEKNNLCYFGSLDVGGSENIDPEIVSSLLFIEEDALFSYETIAQSYKNIYRHDGISKASIDTDVDTNKSRVNVKVSIVENEKPLRFQAGLGVSSDEGAMALLGLKHRNFYGDLKTLSLSTRVTQIRQTIKLNYDVPLIDKNYAGFEVGFKNEDFIGFEEQSVFGSMYLKQQKSLHSFRESLVFDNAKTYRSSDLVLFPHTSLLVISPKFEWNYDTRDKLLDPSRGYFLNAEIMGSLKSQISDASYYKYKLSGAVLFPFGSKVLGIKSKYGSLRLYEGEIPASYRFYTGGMYSNRAYGYRELGELNAQGDPKGSYSVFESTIEWRFGIYGDVRGVVFSDVSFIGDDAIPEYGKAYTSAGFGLRYKTPIGPIALDFGVDTDAPSKQYAIHFHIGELF